MIKTKIIFNTLLIILLVYFVIQIIMPYIKVERFENKNHSQEEENRSEEEKTDEEEDIELKIKDLNKKKLNK